MLDAAFVDENQDGICAQCVGCRPVINIGTADILHHVKSFKNKDQVNKKPIEQKDQVQKKKTAPKTIVSWLMVRNEVGPNADVEVVKEYCNDLRKTVRQYPKLLAGTLIGMPIKNQCFEAEF